MKIKTDTSPEALKALRRAIKTSTRKGLPRYAWLRDALLAAIEAGHWSPGERVPTEAELARTTPFSLGTVQRAMRALVDEGVVQRVQGSGSFVSPVHTRIEDPSLCRFLGEDGRSFLPLFSRVVSRVAVAGAGPWREHLGASASLLRIDRVLNVNGEFDVYSRFYFDAARFRRLASRPLEQLAGTNFKELLREEFSMPVSDPRQRILIGRMPSEVCRRLGLAKGSAGAILEITGRAGADDATYYQQVFVPPSPRKLVPYPGNP
jgi:GntR family transcriptional regulator